MKLQLFVNGKFETATAQCVQTAQSMVEQKSTVMEIAAKIRRTRPFTQQLVMKIKDQAQGKAA